MVVVLTTLVVTVAVTVFTEEIVEVWVDVMRLVTRPTVVVAITVFVTGAQSELFVTVMVEGVQVD
jgi:hypothetical protein